MSFLTQPISITQFLFGKKRKLAGFSGYVTLSEETTDRLTVTKHPVQQGAVISDHAFKEPTVFSASLIFGSNNAQLTKTGADNVSTTQDLNIKQTYEELLKFQESRVPFEIVTPKRVYTSMLLTSISLTTDKSSENILSIRISCEQVIIVSVGIVQVSRSLQKNAGATGATEKVGKKNVSLLQQAVDAFRSTLNGGG